MKLNPLGFTSKELLMVFIAIGVLCLAAIPPFHALQNSRRRSDMSKTATVLKATIDELKHKHAEFPVALDDNPDQSACLNCFAALLPEGLSHPLWYKFSPTVYLFSANGNHATPTDYQETGDYKLEYEPATGEIKLTKIANTPSP